MTESSNLNHCLNCNASENEMPLVNLVYSGKPAFICSKYLPILIHKPELLIGKIEGAEKIKAAKH